MGEIGKKLVIKIHAISFSNMSPEKLVMGDNGTAIVEHGYKYPEIDRQKSRE